MSYRTVRELNTPRRERAPYCGARNKDGHLCLHRTLHESGKCPQHRPGGASIYLQDEE